MTTQTIIDTLEAKRISKRLLNHWKHKFEVSETEQESRIFMPTATVVLTAAETTLLVRIESELDDLTHLQHVVIDHLNRMAQQEFQAEWKTA
ncbi:DUF2218 domain-containing protein [Acinetobacter sp. MD2(2019)]|uniref:DUF2218 domain-containing protein n=1 Tax=Acinetobacter sp. MD2(2019) TaxID=2605273 RepID=UPI002D1EB799|nr:DUF2218 domain-containing protein [Acinetobacter sp. MD2(2019)]MEB3753627.1 DUF2218 domain-containing protein [Acinetobacter sp. MD2(2019)]